VPGTSIPGRTRARPFRRRGSPPWLPRDASASLPCLTACDRLMYIPSCESRHAAMEVTVTLFRPTGPEELKLVEQSGGSVDVCSLKLGSSWLFVLLLFWGSSTMAQEPTGCSSINAQYCSSTGEGEGDCPGQCKCDQTYALCIAASCNPATGECGVMAPPAGSPSGTEWSACDQQGLEAGTCGPCYVFTGCSDSDRSPQNDGCPLTCPEAADGLHSTFSETLVDEFPFAPKNCGSGTGADCMGGACSQTGSTVTLTTSNGGKVAVPTAICTCVISTQKETLNFQGLSSASIDCEAVWSVF